MFTFIKENMLFSLFKVFLGKNLLFIRYNWIVLSVISTICTGTIVIYLKAARPNDFYPALISEKRSGGILLNEFPQNQDDAIYYAPPRPDIDEFMDDIRNTLQYPSEFVIALEDMDVQNHIEQHCRGNCFGIRFDSFPSNGNGTFAYTISSSSIRMSPKKRYVNDVEAITIKEDDEYIRSGYFILQHQIDRTYLEKFSSTGRLRPYDLQVNIMPTIELEQHNSTRVISFGFVYSILLSVLLLATFLVPLVEEKHDGIKEFLNIATPLNFLNGLTFFLIRLVLYAILTVIFLVFAAYYHALGSAPLIYAIILCGLYVLSAMSYSYLISVCFHSVFYAKVGGLALYIIPYVFYSVKGTFSTFAAYCLSASTFINGMNNFQIFTLKFRNFTFTDHMLNVTDDSFKMLTIYAILIMQCFVYFAIYYYLSSVFPGPGGIKKDYLFILRASSFRKKHRRNEYTTGERGTVAIVIQELEKCFRTKSDTIMIADRLNMEIKSKQITVLLGHNGVGKTTILNMIMGSETKDSGKIIVCSERNVASYRHLIGFCPQHNVFMYYMTCQQHLEFFARLRGISGDEANKLSLKLLEKLKLSDKAHVYGKCLSGGMKRRLSLGIALSGETKVIVLDEPSSGLDIASRRELWDVLLVLRKEKAILLTTHHMEEAEMLGDTICILANGRVKRSGTPLELKRKLGCGYILKLCVFWDKFDANTFMGWLRDFIPGAKILDSVRPSLRVSLPYAYRAAYSEVLRKLDTLKESMHIESYSVTDTSLEDVFLNSDNNGETTGDEVDGPQHESYTVPYKHLETPVEVGMLEKFYAIYYKKLIFMRSKLSYTLLMLSLPFISIALAIMLIHLSSGSDDGSSLDLTLQNIRNGSVFIHKSHDTGDTNMLASTLSTTIEKYGLVAQPLIVPPFENASTALLNMQSSNLPDFLQNVIGLIEINDSGESLEIVITYSNNIYHTSVMLLNLIDNAYAQITIGKNSSIRTTYIPIRRFVADISATRLEYYAVIVPSGLFFYMFFYLVLPYYEHRTGFKNLQTLPSTIYWLLVLSFDILLHLIICILLALFQTMCIRLFNAYDLYNMNEQSTIIMSIFWYGVAYLPILYCFANGFRSISTISTYLIFMLVVSEIIPLITSYNFQAIQEHETEIMFLSFLPDFNLNHQLRVINENFMNRRRNLQTTLNTNTFFYPIMVFILSFSFFLFVLENKKRRENISKLIKPTNCRQAVINYPDTPEENSLVRKEKDDVQQALHAEFTVQSQYALVVDNLQKVYDWKPVVNDLSFAVKKQECFGLLGVNGAGKTTTFQMLTTNTTITKGTIKIEGIDIFTNENEYRRRFGYCPQNDCLNEFMTSYQMLKYMALLRGIPCNQLNDEIAYWIENLDLRRYENKKIINYSGGTKRKLNTALAMICSPSLVMLDEPTTGVDPASRRFLWTSIQEFLKRDKTIILTSHSMDECEQLCNRLAIMVNGKFACIGSVPELKRLFGDGFTIQIELKNKDDAEIKNNTDIISEEIHSLFADSKLRESHAGMLTYYIKNCSHITWADVFDNMEVLISRVEFAELIENYSINESALEDIFLKFDQNYPVG